MKRGNTMKATHLATFVLAAGVAGFHAGAQAQFSLKNPLASTGSTTSAPANAGQVLRNTRDALLSFARAELGLSDALGGYNDLAAQRQLLDNMKSGDAAAVKKEEFEAIVTVHKSAQDHIDRKVAENAKLDASNRTMAGKAMVEYLKGLSSTRKMVSSVQDLGKNPASLMGEAGTALYVAKEVPSVATGAVSTTGKLVSYLTANGIDVPKDDLPK
jgi:hypothetical protein